MARDGKGVPGRVDRGAFNLIVTGFNTTQDPVHMIERVPTMGTNRGGLGVYSFAQNQRGEVLQGDTMGTLGAGGGKPGQGYPAVSDGSNVRKLTPRECERLQGFPDDWTLTDDRGAKIPDTHRYRFMGNAVTVNVIEWIGRRVRLAQARARAAA